MLLRENWEEKGATSLPSSLPSPVAATQCPKGAIQAHRDVVGRGRTWWDMASGRAVAGEGAGEDRLCVSLPWRGRGNKLLNNPVLEQGFHTKVEVVVTI